tara:strand:- start:161 stop:364 length:204 start_codon:yes stop_codon:yes gene_type:complete
MISGKTILKITMKFDLKIDYLGKKEEKFDAEKDMYYLTFKTYNAQIEGKFEKSELRHMIQILDNAVM